jgi:hypothetical protein
MVAPVGTVLWNDAALYRAFRAAILDQHGPHASRLLEMFRQFVQADLNRAALLAQMKDSPTDPGTAPSTLASARDAPTFPASLNVHGLQLT